MIKLKRLKFSNMFSYGENNVIDFTKHQIAQLTGPNGFGKTSLVIILQELLFSKNIKGLKKDEIQNTFTKANSWSGELEFDVDASSYKVSVVRKGDTSKVKLEQDGKDISEHRIPDTYKKIEHILGIPFKIFSQLTYQSSKDLLEFLYATDTTRKKFLIELFNLEQYLLIGEQFKTKLVAAERELALLEGERRNIETTLSTTVIPERGTAKIVPVVDDTLAEKIRVLKTELTGYLEQCKKIDTNNVRKAELSRLVFDLTMAEPIEPKEEKAIYRDITNSITRLQTEKASKQNSIKKLDTNDKCYACGQLIDNSKNLELKTNLEQEIVELDTKLQGATESLKHYTSILQAYEILVPKWNINKRAIEKFEELGSLIDKTLPVKHPDYSDIQNQLKTFSTALSTQETAQKEVLSYNESINNRNIKIQTLEEQNRNFRARQALLENDIIKLQQKINNLTILKKAFSPSGVVAYKLENVVKELETSINRYLSILSDGQFQFEFQLTGEKLNIIIINNGIEKSIESLSGGEFGRVQTSVLLAVRNTLGDIGNKQLNLLFLDEITGVLDAAGKEKLFEVLSEEQDTNIMLIAHDYSHPLISKIEIEKLDNVSYINAS